MDSFDDLDDLLADLRQQRDDSTHEPRAFDKQRTLDEHFKEWTRGEAPKFQAQFAQLTLEMLEGREFADDRELLSVLSRSSPQIWALASSCHEESYLTEPLPKAQEIWRHRNLDLALRKGYTSPEYVHGNTLALTGVARTYLAQDLRSPTFEVLLVDAMVATEICSFGEEIKKNPSRFAGATLWYNWSVIDKEHEFYIASKGDSDRLGWLWIKYRLERAAQRGVVLYLLPLAIAYLAATNGYEALAGASVAFVSALVAFRLVCFGWRILRRVLKMAPPDPLAKTSALLTQMNEAYTELKSGTSSSPKRVRERLAKAADDGAVWAPEVFALLDLAISRNRGGWG